MRTCVALALFGLACLATGTVALGQGAGWDCFPQPPTVKPMVCGQRQCYTWGQSLNCTNGAQYNAVSEPIIRLGTCYQNGGPNCNWLTVQCVESFFSKPLTTSTCTNVLCTNPNNFVHGC